MTTHQRVPDARISGPEELVQAVPYLLGFHPQRSLVLVGTHGGMLVVTARLDLDDVLSGGGSSSDVSDLTVPLPIPLVETLEAIRRGGATAVVAVVYPDAGPARDGAKAVPTSQHLMLSAAVRSAADEAGCAVLDVLEVAAGRWRSLECMDPACCPPTGRPLPDDPSAFAAAATVAGVVALGDRHELVAQFDPLPVNGAVAAAIAELELQALAGPDGRRTSERAPIRALLAAARASEDHQHPRWPDALGVARFGVALTRIPVRDAVWTAIDNRRVDGRPLWRDLARRLPRLYTAAPLFLFGWTAWRAGDGTSAGIAAERALDVDPAYSAADLLLHAIRRGVDPRALPALRLPRSA